MLKKVGIAAATVTAGLIALSPIAFAGEGHHGGHKGHGGGDQVNISDSSRNSQQTGLVNVGDVNALENAAVCPAVNANTAVGVLGALGGPANAAQEDSGAATACSPGDSVNQLNNK